MNAQAQDVPVALVAGASRGLGLEIARVLNGRGFHVALAARDVDGLARAASEFGERVSTHQLDVTDRARMRQVVDEVSALGPLEVAIHVAGIIQVGPAEDMQLEHFDQALDVMAKGPINLAWSVLPGMRQRRSGHIGVVASVGGVVSPPHMLPYSTAKFAAVGFCDGLAAELLGSGVTATTIVPGLMRTGSHDNAVFTGNAAAEHNWFSVAASLPVLSADSTRAARQMVDGVLAGRPLVTITPVSWAAYRARGLAPATVTRLMGLAGRVLPGATGNHTPVPGADLPTPAIVQKLTVLGRRAAKRNNQGR
ncbi:MULTISPECIES: SDR family NAD(P)-dependent oxidoreductase [unclassified Luteococcus]|uniref:SDR family NAD(P)-dependent oxidoreductase n=1 Tax=unclassified Luteococcus TaxID=2639923 RepID=UPI00313D0D86